MFSKRTHISSASTGFTLIELLIVVAIIAILAAIAVPNFLEAQTRAKISRVQSDMRIIAYGLDMYRLDYNDYPPSPWPRPGYYTSIGLQHPSNKNSNLFKEITTPVAYINSIPRTPFAGLDWIKHTNGPESPSGYYQGHARKNEPGFVVRQWLHESVRELVPNWENKQYWIGDVGPNRQWDNTPRGNGSIQVPYDPSNGTISMGNIYRWGPQ